MLNQHKADTEFAGDGTLAVKMVTMSRRVVRQLPILSSYDPKMAEMEFIGTIAGGIIFTPSMAVIGRDKTGTYYAIPSGTLKVQVYQNLPRIIVP